jgi:hypothetical protein
MCWREQDEPVWAGGLTRGSVQWVSERLMYREAGSVPILYSAEDIRV